MGVRKIGRGIGVFKWELFLLDSTKLFLFIYLFIYFEVMANVPVNSYGHVETLPPYYGTFTQKFDALIALIKL